MLFEREGVVVDDSEMKAVAEAIGHPGKRELLIAVGEGKVSTELIADEIAKGRGFRRHRSRRLDLPVPDKAEGWFALRATNALRFRVPGTSKPGPNALAALEELNFNTPVEFSAEGVVPGDRLVGILEPNRAMHIYPIHSEALAELYESDVAWIDVRWDVVGSQEREYKVAISMESVNKPGSLAHVSSAIAACDANINNLVMRMISPDFHQLVFEIEVRDLAQLTDVLATLKRSPGLHNVQRATAAEASAIATLEWNGKIEQAEPV